MDARVKPAHDESRTLAVGIRPARPRAPASRRHVRALRMSADVPSDKSFDLVPETVQEVIPGVRRLLANNPGPFTFKGTVSYIVGRGQVAVVDPGPLDETHIAALLDAVRGETVTHIFVTHTHRDHSPAVPRIKAATGAVVLAEGAHRPARALNIGEAPRLDASNDTDFRPDRTLAAGEADIPTLVRAIYVGLDPRLVKAAGLSVFAHLEDLVARGPVATDGEPSIEGRYRLR